MAEGTMGPQDAALHKADEVPEAEITLEDALDALATAAGEAATALDTYNFNALHGVSSLITNALKEPFTPDDIQIVDFQLVEAEKELNKISSPNDTTAKTAREKLTAAKKAVTTAKTAWDKDQAADETEEEEED